MLGAIRSRFRGGAAPACSCLLATLVFACAASTARDPRSETDQVTGVTVDQMGESTVITLEGLDHPVFTAFAQEDPDRIVVDLADVDASNAPEHVAVDDGLVESVTFSPYSSVVGEAMTRVEVALATAAEYEVGSGDDGLEIRVEPTSGVEPGGADGFADGRFSSFDDDDPWAIEPISPAEAAEDAEMATDTAWDSGEAAGMQAVEPALDAGPASTLTAVEATDTGEGVLIHLVADGMLDAQSFTLEDPARLVVDLPGVESEVEAGPIEVGSSHTERVRIGQHPDHVRVVIDGGSADQPFESRRMVPVASGLLVALGRGQELDDAVAMATGVAPAQSEPTQLADASETLIDESSSDGSSPDTWQDDGSGDVWAAAEPIDTAAGDDMGWQTADVAHDDTDTDTGAMEMEHVEPMAAEAGTGVSDEGGVVIYGVEFDTTKGRDRVVVMGERAFEYLVYEPDPETVVLAIEEAVIDPDALVRITPAPGGPVSLVTSFEQPDTQGSEVRVVIKRASGLKPEVSRRGSVLVMDFPRDGRVAETPPVMDLAETVVVEATPAAGSPTELAAMPAASPRTDGSAPATDTTPTLSTPSAAPAPAAPALGAPAITALHSGAPAEAIPASLEPPAAIAILEEGGLIDGKEYSGRRISLDFKDVEITDVLRLIAEVSDLNVIAGDEVAGRVTIRLVDVPWDQALDVILLTKSLGFMRVGNVLRIAPSDIIKQEEELRLQERRAKEKLEDLVVKLQPVNYADVKDMEKMIKRLLSPRGSVNVDKRTNTVIMKDIPSVIDEATALIKAVDTQTPQVMIEAKIVEASLDFSREFGTVWSFGAQPLVDPFGGGSTARSDLGNDAFRVDTTSPFGNNAIFSNPITAGPTGLFNLAGFLLDEKLNLGLQLQAAEVNGDGKVISSPRVVTLDNSEARIQQGVSIPFQTFENGDAQLEFVDAVLSLNVTPHITADKSIIMKIEVSRNAPDDSVFTLTGSPAIAKNQVETETLVKDGQTLVLGGIYVIDKSQRQSRVPYLHRIPILGSAFRSDEISDSRKELLIFVTPRIVVVPESAS